MIFEKKSNGNHCKGLNRYLLVNMIMVSIQRAGSLLAIMHAGGIKKTAFGHTVLLFVVINNLLLLTIINRRIKSISWLYLVSLLFVMMAFKYIIKWSKNNWLIMQLLCTWSETRNSIFLMQLVTSKASPKGT